MFNPEETLQAMVLAACDNRASDIHFQVISKNCRIRFRKDAKLIDYDVISKEDYLKLVLWIKYRSHLNLNQAKGPQSSAFDLLIGGQNFRIRVSSLYTGQDESLVLRIHPERLFERYDELFYVTEQGETILQALKQWTGLVLITGPTGAGKTTLAYALLNEWKRRGSSIVSIEDPVEHYDQGYVQLEINESAGVGYEVSVKEVLRHDPDVIFIGEIRNQDSARAAIRASLTGHLVISTLHAKSAIQAFYRLQELGITLIEMEQVLGLLTNQRLVIGSKGKCALLEILDRRQIEEAIHAIHKGEFYSYQTLFDLAQGLGVQVLKG